MKNIINREAPKKQTPISRAVQMAITTLLLLVAVPARGALFMPAGSTVYMEWSDNDGPGDILASNTLGVGNGIPLTSIANPPFHATGFAEMTATGFKGLVSSEAGGFIIGSILETYTVHGTGTGPVNLTTTLHGSGNYSSVLIGTLNRAIGLGVNLKIGTFNPSPTLSGEGARVTPFDPTDASESFGLPTTISPTSVITGAFDITAFHNMTVNIGDTFSVAYGYILNAVNGTIDFTHTGTVGWTLPEGVSLTSDHGATFSSVPVPEPSTYLAGALLLLPFAGSTIRSLRKR